MKRVSNITIILTQCINFAAIFKQNVSKSKDNMTHCELQQLKSAQRTQDGLYQSDYEHDACGVGMVVNIHGPRVGGQCTQSIGKHGAPWR